MQDELGFAPHAGSGRRITIREFDGTTGMIDGNDYEISVEERKKYEKKWVAVLNGKIVCSGDTMKEAGDKFKKTVQKRDSAT